MSFKNYLRQSKAKPQTGLRTYTPGQAVTTSLDYRNVALEGYQRNPYVFAALNKLATMYANIPEKLVRVDSSGEELDVDRHEVLDIRNNPNADQGGGLFKRERYLYYKLSGRSFVRKFAPDTGDNRGKPRELWNIRPDAIQAISNDVTGQIGSFKMQVSGEEIDRDEIIYTTSFNPLNTEDGFSPVMSAQLAVDTFNDMMKWNLATMQNQGIPSVYIWSDQEITKSDADNIKSRFVENNAGWQNAREPFVAGGGLKIERVGQTAQEADWLNSMKELARMILIGIDVPPDIIIGNSTFENRKEAMKDLLNNVVIPDAEMFLEVDNKQLVSDYGENLKLKVDKANIELLQESQNDLWDRVIRATESGLLSIGEGRGEMGQDQDVEHADQFYMKTGMQPVASDLNEEDQQ